MKKLSSLRENIKDNTFAENRANLVLGETGLEKVLSTGMVHRVNIIALGDVGTNLLMGLKLLGGDLISEIGIYDLNQAQLCRLEMEFNQMAYPPTLANPMPTIRIVEDDDDLMDCDILIFCASKGVPEIGATGDMRMMQLEANLELVKSIGSKIKANRETKGEKGFNGFVAVVSDPVDQLCKGMLESSGLKPTQIRGFGLGVMAARAKYFAERDENYELFLKEGRAFGPHGQDLVIANSIENYDEEISLALTKDTVEANLRVRELGYKPFLAPAISSAAISILLTLRGEWNYGSLYIGTVDGGAYLGVLSRITPEGVEFEDPDLPDPLFARIEKAYRNLL